MFRVKLLGKCVGVPISTNFLIINNMSQLEILQKATTKKDLARILGVNAAFLTRTLYIRSITSQYYQFQIPKRNGGYRIINAPTSELKDIQARLSNLLLNCIDIINAEKNITPKLSHGFTRNKSIITNAQIHTKQKNVLNIDLNDFFDSFNFGRVRGFFIKNKNFNLHDGIATVLAKIACLNNTLPQGSPCSPVITNLIAHPLDIRLAMLAKKNNCLYSRYADDITFSTRKLEFPAKIASISTDKIIIGKSLNSEIRRAGFSLNHSKTRIQLNDSRQDVTGLVVNRKVNVKNEYWRITRAMCHRLFMTGEFTITIESQEAAGTISELYGRLDFIDSIDRHNHMLPTGAVDHRFSKKNIGLNYRAKLNVREKTFSKFLYYYNFYANEKPIILCEGKTDYIYLKSAINILSEHYPILAQSKTEDTPYKSLIKYFEYTDRTKFLLDLFGGGIYLKKFVERYIANLKYYNGPGLTQPVILLLDNDSGPTELLSYLQKKSKLFPNCPSDIDAIRKSSYLHVTDNLYIILIPRLNGRDTEIEDLFDNSTLNTVVDGRTFDRAKEADTINTYGKNIFATKVVRENKTDISFNGFKQVLNKIVKVIQHHNSRS